MAKQSLNQLPGSPEAAKLGWAPKPYKPIAHLSLSAQSVRWNINKKIEKK